MESDIDVKKMPHHDQLEFCLNRAQYRQGRKLTAVKVYTVNDESKYLIINGVPAINLSRELEAMCRKYGQIVFLRLLADYPHDEFAEVYLVKYEAIKSARFAKKQLDGKSFYGGVIHVCYAPELESVEETREKLQDRRKTIAALTRYKQDPSVINPVKKKVNPNADKLLSRLRPDLQEVEKNTRIGATSGPVNNKTDRKEEDPSESNYKHFDSLIPSDCYKIPHKLLDVNESVKKLTQFNNGTDRHKDNLLDGKELVKKSAKFDHTSDRCDSLPSTSGNNLSDGKVPLVPRSVKRPSELPQNPTKKKIKIFRNKNILSYKQSGDEDEIG